MNTEYFNNLTDAVNAAPTCADVERIGAQAISELTSTISQMNAQIAVLAPLLTAPGASFTSIITWITNYISLIQGPYNKLVSDVSALQGALSSLTNAVNNKKSQLGCS